MEIVDGLLGERNFLALSPAQKGLDGGSVSLVELPPQELPGPAGFKPPHDRISSPGALPLRVVHSRDRPLTILPDHRMPDNRAGPPGRDDGLLLVELRLDRGGDFRPPGGGQSPD